jgi:lipoyl(octanoyl) transferase
MKGASGQSVEIAGSGDVRSGAVARLLENQQPGGRLEVHHLGTFSYQQGLDLQAELVQRRREGSIGDTLLLLQHPHVLTLGSSFHQENLLASPDELAGRGIEVHRTGRGGDVTYHGPGQIVGYAILDLKPDRCDLHEYLRDLEQVIIDALDEFGLSGRREEGMTGVWVEQVKVAAIGVRVSSGWITSHGFALNVSTDLSFFDTIIPCGISDYGVGSISQLLERAIGISEVEEVISRHFLRHFDRIRDLDDREITSG